MKSLKFFYVLFIISTSFVYAQREADVLINGRCLTIGDYNCNSPEDNLIFRFNKDSLESIIEPITLNLATNFSRAAFSDKNTGELLFASNGWRLINGNGQILSEKLWRDDVPWPNDSYDTTMVLNSLGPLFLDNPGNKNQAFLFYGQYLRGLASQFGPDLPKADRYFTYALLDIPSRSLISKNNIILDEFSASGDMQATRHANGRDWWLIKPGMYEDEYFIGLLDPSGIQMNKIIIPNLPHRGRFETYSYFNQNGDKYIHFTGKRYKFIHEFTFDRCSGQLSVPIVHDLTPFIYTPGDYTASTISPDGSKLYIRQSIIYYDPDSIIFSGGLFQYDLNTSIFSSIDTICGTILCLSPNYQSLFYPCRIDINGQLTTTLSFITNPNEKASNLNIDYYKYTVTNSTGLASPSNFANFRLGKLVGSPCDTIVSSVQAIPAKEININLYPNPAKDLMYVEFPYPNGKPFQISMVDAMGKLVYRSTMNAEGGSLNLANLGLSN
jgi:hypothetical protein